MRYRRARRRRMLGRDVTIVPTDLACGEPVLVKGRRRAGVFGAGAAVVVNGTATFTEGGCCPPGDGGECTVAAADRCCGVMNFFASPDSADAWLAAYPQVTGVVLTKKQALRLGVDIFGHLIDD